MSQPIEPSVATRTTGSRHRGRRGIHRVAAAALTLAVVGVGSAACGDDDTGEAATTVSDAWTRPSAPDATTAAFYLTLTNTGDAAEVVESVSSAACDRTELHISTMGDDEVMSMSPAGAEDLWVRAGSTLTFEPGGLHVMCIGFDDPFVVGDEIDLRLTLTKTGTIDATVVVADR